MMTTVTAKGGPLNGKRYEVPAGMPAFRHGVLGEYRVEGDQAVWAADADHAAAVAAAPVGLTRAADRARQGLTVLLVGHTARAASEAFTALAATTPDADRITRTKGRQRIEFANGGRVIALSAQGKGGRGISADVLYLLGEVPGSAYDELIPALSASPVAEVIHHEEA